MNTRPFFKSIGLWLIALFVITSACEKVSFNDQKHNDKEEKADDSNDNKADINDRNKACTLHVTVVPFSLTRTEAYTPDKPKILYALFDSLGRRCWRTEQLSGVDPDYGHLTANIDPGRYHLLTIGHHTKKIEKCTLDSVTFADDFPLDTYCRTTSFTISKGENKTLSVSLENITAQIEITLPDGKPKDLRSVSVTFGKGNIGFSPLSGFAYGDDEKRDFFSHDMFTQENNYTVSSYRFLTSNQETTNIIVALTDFNGDCIGEYSFEGVLLKRREKAELKLK